MRTMINGEARDVPDGVTLLGLLGHLDLDPRTVVVEHNRHIVRQEGLEGVVIKDGDEIELVHFVGGG